MLGTRDTIKGDCMEDIKMNKRMITVDEFVEMRKAVGWGYPNKEAIHIGLNNTLFSVCVEREHLSVWE